MNIILFSVSPPENYSQTSPKKKKRKSEQKGKEPTMSSRRVSSRLESVFGIGKEPRVTFACFHGNWLGERPLGMSMCVCVCNCIAFCFWLFCLPKSSWQQFCLALHILHIPSPTNSNLTSVIQQKFEEQSSRAAVSWQLWWDLPVHNRLSNTQWRWNEAKMFTLNSSYIEYEKETIKYAET